MKYLDGFFIYWKGLLQKSKFVFALFFLLLTILQTVKQTYVFASANHLVISEIQIQGDKSNYDFIELYNPTENSINLGTYRLVKRTSTGATDSNIVAFTQDDEVPSHGYFLWCNTELGTLISCDKTTSSTLANNNSVAIRDGAADTGTIIDAVTFGEVTNTLGEGTALTAPEANQSVERKANSGSTPETMQQGGVDEFLGNGEDTNDNQSDFVTKMTSQPQNKNSQAEPADVLPSLTPSPTVNPTNTPIPTQEPTVTPTVTLTPTPEVTITPTQTPIPTNLPTPTLAPEPTVTPTPGPEEGKVFLTLNFNVGRSSCQVKYKYIRKGWFAFYLPEITCTRNTNSLPWFIS